jgi:hypothetical protein
MNEGPSMNHPFGVPALAGETPDAAKRPGAFLTPPPQGGISNGGLPANSRRAFLRACVRYPILAGLAVLGGALALRKAAPSLAEPCVKQRACRNCRLVEDCVWPQAVAARRNS